MYFLLLFKHFIYVACMYVSSDIHICERREMHAQLW